MDQQIILEEIDDMVEVEHVDIYKVDELNIIEEIDDSDSNTVEADHGDGNIPERRFVRDEKTMLGELCRKYKIEYESEKQQQLSNNCNPKKRKHCQTLPSTGWASRAIREFYAE